MAERRCRGCGVGMPKGPRERNARVWCSSRCRARALRQADPEGFRQRANAANRRRSKARQPDRGWCAHCGGALRRASATHCNAAECQRQRNRERARERYAERREELVERSRRQRAERTPEQQAAEATRRREYARRLGYTDAHRDADQRRRARKCNAPGVEAFSHREIFERDKWRCGICLRRVDANLVWPDPSSASLDHIEPLARGGSHTKANVRLAHLSCNVRRRDKIANPEQLALVG